MEANWTVEGNYSPGECPRQRNECLGAAPVDISVQQTRNQCCSVSVMCNVFSEDFRNIRNGDKRGMNRNELNQVLSPLHWSVFFSVVTVFLIELKSQLTISIY